MRRGLLWLTVVDLRQAWLRPGLAAVAIALAIFAVALFARQIALRQAEVLAGYEATGAATFIVTLSGISDDEIDTLAGAIRGLGRVRSVEAPYNGTGFGLVADTSFLVFRNEKQQEFLGGRTSVIGVDRTFDLARDYHVDLHDMNPKSPQIILGIPLLPSVGAARAPAPGEILLASDVADYVGVRPDAPAIVDLVYTGVEPPIVQRLDGLRLIGTLDVLGPDQGRFEPFWRFAALGRDVLTVRRPDAARAGVTTLPIVLNGDVVREFLASVRRELDTRGLAPPRSLQRDQLVIRADSIGEVTMAEAAVESLLQQQGLGRGCDAPHSRSFCLRVPERNNFRTALQEQSKVSTGGAFFAALLLLLVAIGAAGLQVQTVLARWRDYGVLQAVGFSPRQILCYYGLQLFLVLTGGIALAAIASLMLPSELSGSLVSFAWAAGVSVIAAGLAALPVLLWPLARPPAELLRQSA